MVLLGRLGLGLRLALGVRIKYRLGLVFMVRV